MKKRLCCLLLGGMVIFSGCASQNGQNEMTESIQESTITESKIDEEKAEMETYAYEQPLNIIDDNYRNYYEIFVRSFYDSDGDGIGDLNGVAEKLDYLSDLGINGIWLMPVFQSTTYHKYDVVDYLNVDEEYGNNDDLTALIDKCHQRGIRVILDFVINHTSSQHPWFLEATSYLRTLGEGEEPDLSVCPYVDYYHFSKEQVNGTYYAVEGSEYFYEGSFWSEMPDLNLKNEQLRRELESIATVWMEKGIDGFRMDAPIHFEEGDTEFNSSVLNWMYEYCKAKKDDFYMVSEVWAAEPTIADYYDSETPSMFNFDVADKEGKLIKAARGNYKASKFVEDMVTYQNDFSSHYEDFIDAPFITNHDMGRPSNALLNDPDKLKMAGGLLMTMNGSPFVYYGEEIGMASSGNDDENKRLPMVWSKTDLTGITQIPPNAKTDIESAFHGVDVQIKEHDSILQYYKRAIRLRNENPELARGEIKIIEDLTEEHIAVITKMYEGETIAVCYNTSAEEQKINLTGSEVEKMQIRGYLTVDGSVVVLENGTLTLPQKSIAILK